MNEKNKKKNKYLFVLCFFAAIHGFFSYDIFDFRYWILTFTLLICIIMEHRLTKLELLGGGVDGKSN